MIFLNKSILITGGTGSFGKAMVHYLTSKYKKIKRLVVFSRDELKQYEMSKIYNQDYIRYFLGDVRDLSRLTFALKEIAQAQREFLEKKHVGKFVLIPELAS